MAKIISKIDEITGKTEQDQILKEQFSFLQKMAQAKCEQFEAELKSMFTSGGTSECEVVGNRAIAYYKCQHVDIKAGCGTAIREAINMFFSGGDDVKNGFQKIVETALDTLIGNTSMGEHEEKMFLFTLKTLLLFVSTLNVINIVFLQAVLLQSQKTYSATQWQNLLLIILNSQ